MLYLLVLTALIVTRGYGVSELLSTVPLEDYSARRVRFGLGSSARDLLLVAARTRSKEKKF